MLRSLPDDSMKLRGFTSATAEALEQRTLFSRSLPADAQLVWRGPPGNVVAADVVGGSVTLN